MIYNCNCSVPTKPVQLGRGQALEKNKQKNTINGPPDQFDITTITIIPWCCRRKHKLENLYMYFIITETNCNHCLKKHLASPNQL